MDEEEQFKEKNQQKIRYLIVEMSRNKQPFLVVLENFSNY